MAILNLLASQWKCSLFKLLTGCDPLGRDRNVVEYNQNSSSSIQICALVDCNGSPMEVALAVAKLAAEGFTTFKMKVVIQLVT